MNYTVNNAPLSWRHIRIVAVASLGQLIGTGLATLVGVIIPLYQILAHPELSSVMQGLIGAMDLIGIIFGSYILGKLSDQKGYLALFRLCPLTICIASVISLLFPSIPVLIICLFIMGFAIGGEYSLDSDYVSELMPDKWKFIAVGSTKAASALGNIIVAAVCFFMVDSWTDSALWPRLLWIMVAISGLMLVLRIRFWESPIWLASHGKIQEATTALHKFLGDNISLPPSVMKTSEVTAEAKTVKSQSVGSFVKSNWKNIIFTGIPWACEGLGVYGIGVFLPILVMALGIEHMTSGVTAIQHVASSVQITFWISCIMLPGFILGLALINKVNGAKLQALGFILCGGALLVLLFAYDGHWSKWISIGAFMAFELFLNMGPHLMTYVLPTKVYTVEERGLGVGIATAIGKIGAVLGVFFIPILLKVGGSNLVLIVSVAVMFLGAVVTILFAPFHRLRPQTDK